MIPYAHYAWMIGMCVVFFIIIKVYFDRKDKKAMEDIMEKVKQSNEEHRKTINNLKEIQDKL